MTTMSATEFRAKCLKVIDRVSETGEAVQITKWGKVVVDVVPHGDNNRPFAEPGFAKGRMWITGDITEPADVEWAGLAD